MADGRHFENGIISIYQPRIIRFRSNLVGRCTFQFPWWTFNEKSKFLQRWRTDAILKIVFRYISAPYWPINAKFGSEIQNHIPAQDTWPKLQFSKIQDGDANFHSERGNLTKQIEIFQIQNGGRTPYWKSFFGYISASYWPINAKYGTKWRITCQYR